MTIHKDYQTLAQTHRVEVEDIRREVAHLQQLGRRQGPSTSDRYEAIADKPLIHAAAARHDPQAFGEKFFRNCASAMQKEFSELCSDDLKDWIEMGATAHDLLVQYGYNKAADKREETTMLAALMGTQARERGLVQVAMRAFVLCFRDGLEAVYAYYEEMPAEPLPSRLACAQQPDESLVQMVTQREMMLPRLLAREQAAARGPLLSLSVGIRTFWHEVRKPLVHKDQPCGLLLYSRTRLDLVSINFKAAKDSFGEEEEESHVVPLVRDPDFDENQVGSLPKLYALRGPRPFIICKDKADFVSIEKR